jgi:guanidinopropionase
MSTRKTVLPDARVCPRFAGVATFCRYPLLGAVAPENLPLDWAIYGVPSDAGVTFRPGARFGPRAVRDASQYVKPYHMVHRVRVTDALSIADAGDAPVSPYRMRENLDLVAGFARTLGDPKTTRLLAVGGDHSIAYANLAASFERAGSPAGGLALVHFDSHFDTVDAVWGERWGHASPFIRAIEDGLVNPRKMISVGIKGPLNAETDLDFAAARGVQILTHDEWRQEGASRLETFVSRIGASPAYISFDVDCVDPAYAPGTGTPSVGGFTSAEAFGLLRLLKGIQVAGADVVEVLPDRDVSQITALLAAHVIFEILALDAASR